MAEDLPKHDNNKNSKIIPPAINIAASSFRIRCIVCFGGALVAAIVVSALGTKRHRRSSSSSKGIQKHPSQSPSLSPSSAPETWATSKNEIETKNVQNPDEEGGAFNNNETRFVEPEKEQEAMEDTPPLPTQMMNKEVKHDEQEGEPEPVKNDETGQLVQAAEEDENREAEDGKLASSEAKIRNQMVEEDMEDHTVRGKRLIVGDPLNLKRKRWSVLMMSIWCVVAGFLLVLILLAYQNRSDHMIIDNDFKP